MIRSFMIHFYVSAILAILMLLTAKLPYFKGHRKTKNILLVVLGLLFINSFGSLRIIAFDH